MNRCYTSRLKQSCAKKVLILIQLKQPVAVGDIRGETGLYYYMVGPESCRVNQAVFSPLSTFFCVEFVINGYIYISLTLLCCQICDAVVIKSSSRYVSH